MSNMSSLEVTLPPGEYGCTWDWLLADGSHRACPGSVELLANKQPSGLISAGVPVELTEVPDGGGWSAEFPQEFELPTLSGRLHNGTPVTMTEVHVTAWGPDNGFVDARGALIGLELSPTDAAQFRAMRLQLEGMDAISGRPPISAVTSPEASAEYLDGEWVVRGEPLSTQLWQDAHVKLQLSFDLSSRVHNGYGFELRFTPVLRLESTEPLTMDQLVDDWLTPLRRVVCLATGHVEDLTYWALLPWAAEESALVNGRSYATVYASGISQQPFVSDSSSRRKYPVVLLARDDVSLLDMVKTWRRLNQSHHPLIETYGEFVTNQPQHPRSRFLLLAQALEGLYGFETEQERAAAVARHRARRDLLLADPALQQLTGEGRSFIKKYLHRQPHFGSFEDSIKYCLETLPVDLTEDLESATLCQRLRKAGASSTLDALRMARNKLAHGTEGFDLFELHEVSLVLDRVARAHLLRIIGCPENVQRRALKYPLA